MKLVCTPYWLQLAFPSLTWKMPENGNKIYLTFDDGPTPEVTPMVLDLLLKHNASATFFCTGHKAEKYPELTKRIQLEGHTLANHGYLHLDGFKTSKKKYCLNAKLGADITGSTLFRPPYGRITPWQINALKSKYNIIMWSVMSMDFSSSTSNIKCLQNVKSNTQPGSIIVFHDTLQAKDRLMLVLPEILKWLNIMEYKTATFSQNQ